MKIYCKTLAILTVIATFSMPAFSQVASDSVSRHMLATADTLGATEAATMTPAIAILSRNLDAGKDPVDSTITAELRNKVTLSDGTVLPSRSVLTGKITLNEMQQAGTSKFAVRFDQAQLKSGKTIPIKATIVDILGPGVYQGTGNDINEVEPNDWTAQMLQVEQPGVVPGVDFHSEISSHDSGIFVSTKKHDVKIPAESELKLAIGPDNSMSTSAN
ncbi:MAG TPA: hypothetical protein VNU92_16725 [Edaphobacter sp.]|jgi:hypothetical protein|nr:hypothetical protein [Edaphobacter sp.]